MAKISIEHDTKTKELSVKMDGKTIDNVGHVSISKDSQYYSPKNEGEEALPETHSVSIHTSTKNEDEGYSTHNIVMAKKSREGQQAIKDGACDYELSDEFVVLKDSTEVRQSVANYFRKLRK